MGPVTHLEEPPIPPCRLGFSFCLYEIKSAGRVEAPQYCEFCCLEPFLPRSHLCACLNKKAPFPFVTLAAERPPREAGSAPRELTGPAVPRKTLGTLLNPPPSSPEYIYLKAFFFVFHTRFLG